MSVKTADRSFEHLYPPFREKLRAVLEETGRLTGEAWRMTEGYRSAERQTWLYAQGRTRPGKIVTWMRTPKWHGTGLAADCLPIKRGYGAPMAWWERLRAATLAHGLDNPAWGNGDLGHVQLTNETLRARALVWVRAGFRDPVADPIPANGIHVVVNGEPVPDAAGALEEGRVWVMLRPVTDALDLVIANVTGAGTSRTALLVSDDFEIPVPVTLRAGRAFAKVSDLPAAVSWLPATRTVQIDRRR